MPYCFSNWLIEGWLPLPAVSMYSGQFAQLTWPVFFLSFQYATAASATALLLLGLDPALGDWPDTPHADSRLPAPTAPAPIPISRRRSRRLCRDWVRPRSSAGSTCGDSGG